MPRTDQPVPPKRGAARPSRATSRPTASGGTSSGGGAGSVPGRVAVPRCARRRRLRRLAHRVAARPRARPDVVRVRRRRHPRLQRRQRAVGRPRGAGPRRRAATTGAAGAHRRRAVGRGPGLLQARRRRPRRHRRGRMGRHPQHGLDPGWLDDHPAVRQERLPHRRAHAVPQDEGGGAGGEARAEVLQAGDPRALPQHHLLRPWRLRRRRRVADVLRRSTWPSSPAQAAYLAGLIRSPETADAQRDPETATFRATVLVAMAQEGYITAAERDAADAVPWTSARSCTAGRSCGASAQESFGGVKASEFGTQYFVTYVYKQLHDHGSPTRRSTRAGCASTRHSTTASSRPRSSR